MKAGPLAYEEPWRIDGLGRKAVVAARTAAARDPAVALGAGHDQPAVVGDADHGGKADGVSVSSAVRGGRASAP